MTGAGVGDLIAGLAWTPAPSGCWLWPGPTNRRGQPIVSVEGEGTLVARVAYRLWRKKGHRVRGEFRPNIPLIPTIGICEKLNSDVARHPQPGERLIDNSALTPEDTAGVILGDRAGG